MAKKIAKITISLEKYIYVDEEVNYPYPFDYIEPDELCSELHYLTDEEIANLSEETLLELEEMKEEYSYF